jgi:predicted RNA-binding protein with PUA-like domain
MNHWLMKSEPFKYSWDRMVQDGRTHWDGVRNYPAAANLKGMRLGDHCFFYHSNEDKAVIGVIEVVKEYYPDPSDETQKFGMVDVKPVAPLKGMVTLATIKTDPTLAGIALVRQSRLSVMPIAPDHWRRIVELGGGMG